MKKEMLISGLIEKGWFHQEHFMDQSFCLELLNEAKELQWKKAKIGTGAKRLEDSEIRNDSIYWLDESNDTLLQRKYLEQMKELMELINQELYLGLKAFECHFAHYSTAGFYKKHLDQHQGSNKRAVSTIFYLNEPYDGGELVIYKKENPDQEDFKIKPHAGSFVCFLSNQIYHEVLPTNGERYSLTGWFRTSVF
ncbi:MAG: 2OG-Fe(II) oxygenase [Bacteriovorax sp.]|nr:2OG-Fe(II) oxygenase [Bacteriovorax sp.]